MKIVKMFDYKEIEKATGVDVVFFIEEACNDTASIWYVESPNENESLECNKINDYFLSHGAKEGEEVFIYFCW